MSTNGHCSSCDRIVGNLNAHVRVCQSKLVICKDCGDLIPKYQMHIHKADSCNMRTVHCHLCSTFITASELHHHLDQHIVCQHCNADIYLPLDANNHALTTMEGVDHPVPICSLPMTPIIPTLFGSVVESNLEYLDHDIHKASNTITEHINELPHTFSPTLHDPGITITNRGRTITCTDEGTTGVQTALCALRRCVDKGTGAEWRIALSFPSGSTQGRVGLVPFGSVEVPGERGFGNQRTKWGYSNGFMKSNIPEFSSGVTTLRLDLTNSKKVRARWTVNDDLPGSGSMFAYISPAHDTYPIDELTMAVTLPLGASATILDFRVLSPFDMKEVACSDGNCGWKGDTVDLRDHHALYCMGHTIQCPNEGCDAEFPRSDLPSHMSVCEHHVCPDCGALCGDSSQLAKHSTHCTAFQSAASLALPPSLEGVFTLADGELKRPEVVKTTQRGPYVSATEAMCFSKGAFSSGAIEWVLKTSGAIVGVSPPDLESPTFGHPCLPYSLGLRPDDCSGTAVMTSGRRIVRPRGLHMSSHESVLRVRLDMDRRTVSWLTFNSRDCVHTMDLPASGAYGLAVQLKEYRASLRAISVQRLPLDQLVHVTCPHAGQGCEWSGALRDLKLHQAHVCEHSLIQCPGCEQPMPRNQVPGHLKEGCGQHVCVKPCSEVFTTRSSFLAHAQRCPVLLNQLQSWHLPRGEPLFLSSSTDGRCMNEIQRTTHASAGCGCWLQHAGLWTGIYEWSLRIAPSDVPLPYGYSTTPGQGAVGVGQPRGAMRVSGHLPPAVEDRGVPLGGTPGQWDMGYGSVGLVTASGQIRTCRNRTGKYIPAAEPFKLAPGDAVVIRLDLDSSPRTVSFIRGDVCHVEELVLQSHPYVLNAYLSPYSKWVIDEVKIK
eukprot:gnl/Dysnectes_brevis/681_a750_1293.p1 GENE.gnl/Dysnectes_brevis/681_a750_1293~~gnl/Dysnectes_brevis/681_a750_1293.p1  ORF type:complete len:885 (-),score=172.81 gnl/Dysnectes_brevis/681_a750_1293:1393-4047(-)